MMKFGTRLEPGAPTSQFCLSSYSIGMYMANQPFKTAVVQYASIPGNYVSQS